MDLSKEPHAWTNKLNDNERHFISHVLAFYAASDGIVDETWSSSHLIDTYIKDLAQRDYLFDAVETIPRIKRKADWAIQWIADKQSTFAERLVAFAAVDGIFFSGLFASIFWMRKSGLTPVNLKRRLHPKTGERTIMEAVTIEREFLPDALPDALTGMNGGDISSSSLTVSSSPSVMRRFTN
ncbi:hypothetical protein D9615_009463 [Tricholomella constricta]|uniref:Uncharacterized protein n=1 Tax=Tricholomella constricta TaxID=117010 RepID=A0A8H5LXT8_9AGAR|nr:hypothetical protein D9615_009463 [Tricholomella constricta]